MNNDKTESKTNNNKQHNIVTVFCYFLGFGLDNGIFIIHKGITQSRVVFTPNSENNIFINYNYNCYNYYCFLFYIIKWLQGPNKKIL